MDPTRSVLLRAILVAFIVLWAAQPALASVLIQNMMSASFTSGGEGIEIYRYGSGETESFDDEASFATGTTTNATARGDKVSAFPDLDTDLTNLALGRPTRQSSPGRWRGPPELAVDGNANEFWSWVERTITHTERDFQAWWQVDLEQVTDIGYLDVYNRWDCCRDRTRDVWIHVSDNDMAGLTLAQAQADPDVTSQFIPGLFGRQRFIPVGIEGRFIKIQLQGRNFLSLAEVQVFAGPDRDVRYQEANLINVALDQQATQSSVWDGNRANRAVDGNTNGSLPDGSVAVTNRQQNAWWQVDLGLATRIDYIDITGRTDGGTNRLSRFHVFISDTDQTGRTLAEIIADPDVTRFFYEGSAGSNQFVIDAQEAVGRFVRIQFEKTEFLQLGEVQVLSACGVWESPEFPVDGRLGFVDYDVQNVSSSSFQVSFDGGEYVGPDGTPATSYDPGDILPYDQDGAETARIRIEFCGGEDPVLCSASVNHSLELVGGVGAGAEISDADGFLFRIYPLEENTKVEMVSEVDSQTYTMKDETERVHVEAAGGIVTSPSPQFASQPFSLGIFDASVPQAATLTVDIISEGGAQISSPLEVQIDR